VTLLSGQAIRRELHALKQYYVSGASTPLEHWGGQVERRRRENRGAVGGEGWVWGGAVPMGVVVNFDLGERFPRPRTQQRGSLRPRTRRVAVLAVGAGGGRDFFMPNPTFWGNLGQKMN